MRTVTHSAAGRSISGRLTLMNVMVGGTAIVLTASALMVFDWVTFREGMVRDLSIQARIVGHNTVSAIVFDDPETATTTLSALSASPAVVFAAVVRSDQTILATYQREADAAPPAIPGTASRAEESSVFSSSQLRVARGIVLDGNVVGTVYIWSDLTMLSERVRLYIAIVAGVSAVSLVVTLLVSAVVRRSISEPIAHLADVAREVSERKDYSLRASPISGSGELSLLGDAFNHMLERVETRDAELKRSSDELEQRVEERTAQIESANKELEAFSYTVSHDLRAPLRHMDGYSTLLQSRFGESMEPPARRYLSLIQESAQQMGQLIDDLLSLARISRRHVYRRTVNLNELVESVRDEVGLGAGDRVVEWMISPLPDAECDPGLIRIVFTNLLSNAVKYTRGQKVAVIEISCTAGPPGDVFMVRDNGAGFDQKYVHKLFGVFQRLHRDEEFEGTGIGLATVQRILHAHGGRIWAEGAIDQGATFYFTIGGSIDPPGRVEMSAES
jgi:signal transduction histidine kinase